MALAEGSADAATGHKRIPIANARDPKEARTQVRRRLSDIPYPGALTGRLKRYAAEPAPDLANLTAISERSAKGSRENPPFTTLMPERIDQLPTNFGRKQLVVHAIVTG